MQSILSSSLPTIDKAALILKLKLIAVILSVFVFCLVWVDLLPEISPLWPVMLILGCYKGFLNTYDILSSQSESKNSELNAENMPFVSILIPAHNEASVIIDTIQHLLKQDYPAFEIMVIEDRSSDGTLELLQDFSKNLPEELKPRFKIFARSSDAFPGKSAALNDALRQTKGELITVLDADARIPQDFLRRALPVLEDNTFAALQVPKQIINAETNTLTRWQGYEYELDAALQNARHKLASAVELRGNGMILRRTALLAIGGWTNETVTDDLDLSTKLHLAGLRIAFSTATFVREEGLTDWRPLFKQRARWAQGSINRYLQYGLSLALSTKTSFRTKLDSLTYSLTFILPIAFIIDIFMMLIHRHWLSWFGVWWLLSASFFVSFFWHIWTKHTKNPLTCLSRALLSAVLMLSIWMPVALQAAIKILFQWNTIPQWDKTEHGQAVSP